MKKFFGDVAFAIGCILLVVLGVPYLIFVTVGILLLLGILLVFALLAEFVGWFIGCLEC